MALCGIIASGAYFKASLAAPWASVEQAIGCNARLVKRVPIFNFSIEKYRGFSSRYIALIFRGEEEKRVHVSCDILSRPNNPLRNVYRLFLGVITRGGNSPRNGIGVAVKAVLAITS